MLNEYSMLAEVVKRRSCILVNADSCTYIEGCDSKQMIML